MTQTFLLARLVRRRAVIAGAAMLTALTACSPDDVLVVEDVDVATPESLEPVAALPVLRAGAIGDFAVAFDGGDDNVITYTGLLTDEYINAETFPTRIEIDQRTIQPVNSSVDGVYRSLHRARASARRGADAYANLQPTSVNRLEVLNLEAMTLILFSEQYCNGVALSTFTKDGIELYGEQKTGAQLNEQAIAIFDSVIALGGSSAAYATQVNFARVGKGRALLNLNRPADARAAVVTVPTTFVYQLQHSENTSRQNNGIFLTGAVNRRFSVGSREGVNGLPYRTDSDPRVVGPRGTGSAAVGFDGSTALFLPSTKYANRSASTTVASGVEARLIEAEAQLRADTTGATALPTLNALRSSVVGLSPLTSVTVDILFKERAYWMWLEGHRLGDLRRLVRQYNRPQTSVYPSGTYFKGGSYGTDVNFPIPVSEDNNPNNKGCVDRNP